MCVCDITEPGRKKKWNWRNSEEMIIRNSENKTGTLWRRLMFMFACNEELRNEKQFAFMNIHQLNVAWSIYAVCLLLLKLSSEHFLGIVLCIVTSVWTLSCESFQETVWQDKILINCGTVYPQRFISHSFHFRPHHWSRDCEICPWNIVNICQKPITGCVN